LEWFRLLTGSDRLHCARVSGLASPD
jgi:hypothetical protein